MKLDLKLLLSALILVGFALFIEFYFGWATLLQPWKQLAPHSVLIAVGLTLITYGLRALRFYDYFRTVMRGNFMLCMKLMLQHNLLNNLLPMRSGEISFPVLMARYFAVPATQSVPVLFWFRLMDLHTLLTLALATAGSVWLPPAWNVVSVLLMLPLPPALYVAHTSALKKLGTPATRTQHLLRKVLSSLPVQARAFWRAWAWTWINWIVKLGAFAWVLLFFLETSWPAAWLASIAGDLTSVLPIHGIAGAGTYEAGVVAALLAFQVDGQQALQAAVNLHLFLLGSTLLGGALALSIPHKKNHD